MWFCKLTVSNPCMFILFYQLDNHNLPFGTGVCHFLKGIWDFKIREITVISVVISWFHLWFCDFHISIILLLFLVLDTMNSFRKTVSTILKRSKLVLVWQWCISKAFLLHRSDYVICVTSAVCFILCVWIYENIPIIQVLLLKLWFLISFHFVIS